MWPPGQGRWTGLGAKAGECRGPLRNRAYLTAGSARRLALAGCREPHRHVLDAVDEIGPEPADLAAKRDGGHPLGQGLQQHPQLERRQVPAEAVVRAAAAGAGSATSLCHCSGWSKKASMPPAAALRVVSLPATVSSRKKKLNSSVVSSRPASSGFSSRVTMSSRGCFLRLSASSPA